MAICRVDKEELKFAEGTASSDSIVIENLSSSPIAYKMKTNDPTRFSMTPNPSVVKVGECADVSVKYDGSGTETEKKTRFRLLVAEVPDEKEFEAGKFWVERKEAAKLGSVGAEESYMFTAEFSDALNDTLAMHAELPLPCCKAGDGYYWKTNWDMTDHFGNDDFDERWETRNPLWLGRPPSFFRAGNVKRDISKRCIYLQARHDQPENVRNYELHQKLMDANKHKRVYKDYSTAFVRTKYRQLYGCFEAQVNLAKSDISSAFWLKCNIPGSWDTEIDVFEFSTSTQKQWDQSKIINTNHHLLKLACGTQREQNKGVEVHVDYDLSEKPQKFTLDWTADYIRWYHNDKLIREHKGHPYHQPMHVQFDRESFPGWFGLPKPSSMRVPDYFTVYYLRSWKREKY